jgi:hypothetical protein
MPELCPAVPAMTELISSRRRLPVGLPQTSRCKGRGRPTNSLRGAVSSVRSNIFRHQKVVRRFEGARAVAQEEDEEDPVDQAADPAASTESAVFFQQVYDLCEGDEEIQLLLMARLNNGTPAEVRVDLGWDDKKYKAVQKRMRRLVVRWMLEGKLT